ncbi:glomulin-like isoform X1 [Colias croceus]|uniref:glomulin-like isoform X1 n=1 Tax=Colias crocea TaxID=72248 RepID=UPI001E27F495|nr:glomulin-like isoform X1 [Colias croceus]
MEQKSDVVDLVSSLLDSGKYKEALGIPNEKKYAESFKDNCWDLISIVVSKVQNDTITLKPSLYGACEELLSVIIEKATPEEALLEFIEQIEVAKNDTQFSIILNPLQKLLKKLSVKRGRSLEWCLNSISTYIEAIPIPEHQLEGKERLLMDSDTNVRRIIHVYSLLPSFYQPFVEEVTKNDCNNKTVTIIAAFLISLFGKPLIYMDLDPESGINGQFRQCCEIILKDVCTLVKNVLKFIPYLEKAYKESQIANPKKKTSDNDDDVHPYEHKEKINVTTLSGLFYLTFSGDFEFPGYAVPQVFSSEYIVHSALLSVNHFLQFAEYGPQIKGLALCNNLLRLYDNKTSHIFLNLSIHYDLCKSLINLSIYSSYETVRKNSVKLIGMHINKFDYKGRIMLIKYIIDVANHSGMIGYAITQYKNSLDEAFKESDLPECFSGAQFLNMVKKICYLPHGVESDLVELADQIITALNFLRYLALKDVENKTGIRECFPVIETDYLDKLRTGLNMSKAHYEMKLKELEESKGISSKEDKISINVGGNMLDKIPTKNKKEIIHSALNAFHLIEGLVGRLSECVNINKAQVNNN